MSASERHYSIPEVASLWNLSQDTVRRIFRDVPGVLKIVRPETKRKRAYITLRIPQSVLERAHAAMVRKAAA